MDVRDFLVQTVSMGMSKPFLTSLYACKAEMQGGGQTTIPNPCTQKKTNITVCAFA